ncbi:hypothetical protein CGLO_13256 [Colletotrichum gloeosporioides Cg-14]|uniref:Uncharacterized protein n=1 Tax=Colletotrichum gloeosporioides (strain Cg-14) TaxID=1237896 RepID=T0K6H3_COLGC|nr:hypothetical protein CGLO_13256 [Colletotrichum gloeosporioides Cg-14]
MRCSVPMQRFRNDL